MIRQYVALPHTSFFYISHVATWLTCPLVSQNASTKICHRRRHRCSCSSDRIDSLGEALATLASGHVFPQVRILLFIFPWTGTYSKRCSLLHLYPYAIYSCPFLHPHVPPLYRHPFIEPLYAWYLGSYIEYKTRQPVVAVQCGTDCQCSRSSQTSATATSTCCSS